MAEEHIDIYAGLESSQGMTAHIRYLVWSNNNLLFLVKPERLLGVIKEWGPIFSLSFSLYIAKLPEEKMNVITFTTSDGGACQRSNCRVPSVDLGKHS